MANKKITQLPAGDALTGEELLEAVQDGESVAITVQDVADFGGGGGGPVIARGRIDRFGSIEDEIGIFDVEWSCFAPGEFRVNFDEDYFSETPACVVTMLDRAGFEAVPFARIKDPSDTGVTVLISDYSGNPSNEAFHIVCVSLEESEG